MKLSVSQQEITAILRKLSPHNQEFSKNYPGDRPDRQPIQTVYKGAQHFHQHAIREFGDAALESLMTYAPNFVEFGKAFNLYQGNLPDDPITQEGLAEQLSQFTQEQLHQHPLGFTYTVYEKVKQKLTSEVVEDYRIDFEDGFGSRSDKEEDETAVYVGQQLSIAAEVGSLPYSIGIRVKAFTEELKARSVRTIDLLLTSLLESGNGELPDNFVIMLPKVTIAEQVEALCSFLDVFEKSHTLPEQTIRIEMMVEATQTIMNNQGLNPLSQLIRSAKGRCVAMHFGTYDYTASAGITAAYQEMDHPVCDFAHHMTKVALAHTGIWLSDGATNTIPIGPHTGDLTLDQLRENRSEVHAAWLKGFNNIRHSLWNGFYQGWDLYPSQLPMRYAAVYSFFLESYPGAIQRMKSYLGSSFAKSPGEAGAIAEDAATGQALLNFFLKAENSGAITMDDILVTGLSKEEVQGRSFAAILKGRMK